MMRTHSRLSFIAGLSRGSAVFLGVVIAFAAGAQAAPRNLRVLADVEVDPNAAANQEENGDLVVHYAVPIPEGSSVYAEVKTGPYTTLSAWESQSWGIRRWDWVDGRLAGMWTFPSDWKPVPFAGFAANPYGTGPLWEPVFQAASDGNFLWVPGFRGRVFEVSKSDGSVRALIDPFSGTADTHTFVAGPLVKAPTGIYFNVIRLDAAHPWDADVVDSWLVRIAPDGHVSKVSYSGLVPGAPDPTGPCETQFYAEDLPFPAKPGTPLPTVPCGTQRTALDVAPAFSEDGTVYAVSRAHFNGRYGYLIALGPDLSFRWAATLRNRLHDGCNVAMPPNGSPGGCRTGAADGMDPATNLPPAGVVDDTSSSSPVATPDGVLYGVNTRYNFAQGHLLKFSAGGAFQAAYGFGWDTTPVVRPHDGTYSIVLKENHYDRGSYCGVQEFCPTPRATFSPDDPDAFFVTSLDPALAVEWRYRSVNTESCAPGPGGSIPCVSDHPRGFEFCVNRVAIDGDGTVYANSEDGNLYVIAQNGALASRLFLGVAVGAAYTPVALGADGRVYTQNLGRLIAAGSAPECASGSGSPGGRPPVCPAPAPVPALVGRSP